MEQSIIEATKLIKIKNTIQEVLKHMPHAPFLCLQLSAHLYAMLKDHHGIESSIIAGNLTFKDTIIFQHDFSISGINNTSLQYWAGHAWLEIDGYIIYISLFRTLYSASFRTPYKDEIISMFGRARGGIIGSHQGLQQGGLIYTPVEVLTEGDARGIVNAITHLPEAE